MCVSHSAVPDYVWPMDYSLPASVSTEFLKQKYWSG